MFVLFIVFLIGLCFGSFANVLICRLPQGKSILGRSFCPRCKKQIAWFDNIPLLSFLLLRGRCHRCQAKISIQYPLVELASAFLFVISFKLLVLSYFIFFALLIPVLVAIFVIDVKHQIIPDELIFAGMVIALLFSFSFGNLFSGFSAAAFLLILHLVTKGRGMGLGDVKLAILGGMVTGISGVVNWLFISFLTGAAVGSILILTKKAKLKSKIAFGPFLVAALFLTIFLRL